MKRRVLATIAIASVLLTSCGTSPEAGQSVGMETETEAATVAETEETTVETEETAAQSEQPAIDITPVPVEAGDYENQLLDIYANYEVWKFDDYYYDIRMRGFAVTDFDRDGFLEIVKSFTAGTGHYSHGKIYEITPDGTLTDLIPGDGEEMPELPTFVTMGYAGYSIGWEEEDGNYYYYVIRRNSHIYGHEDSWERFSVIDNEVHRERLAGFNSMEGCLPFSDADYNHITEEEYISILQGYEERIEGFVSIGCFEDISLENIEASFAAWNTDYEPTADDYSSLGGYPVSVSYLEPTYYIPTGSDSYVDYLVDVLEFSDDMTSVTFTAAAVDTYDSDYVTSLEAGDEYPLGDTIEDIFYDPSYSRYWMTGENCGCSFSLQENGQYYCSNQGVVMATGAGELTLPVSSDVVILYKANPYGPDGILFIENYSEYIDSIEDLRNMLDEWEGYRVFFRVVDGQIRYIVVDAALDRALREYYIGEGLVE